MERLTAMLYPGGSHEQYRYDAAGNPVGYRTRAGQVRTSVFDNRNREIQTNWSDSTPDITRTFDAAGRVLSEDNGVVSLTYSYNAANQVLSETTQLTGEPARTVGYTYDAAGHLASTTYPDGNVVAQTYTPRGQIAGIGLDGGTARLIAQIYNWWSLYARLVDRERHREAVTTRPELLGGGARQTRHAGQTRKQEQA